MLYLGSGVRELAVGQGRKLCVFPDASDPDVLYVLPPNQPQVTERENGEPALRLSWVRGDPDAVADDDPEAVALLSLDVNLAWPPALLEQAGQLLMAEDRLPHPPRLLPIAFSAASVTLMQQDTVAADEGDGAEAKPARAVARVLASAAASPHGDHRAVFEAPLNKAAAALITGALDGATPVGLVYSLTFAGLQPAAGARARVDWAKVQQRWSESGDPLFHQSDIDQAIDGMVDDKVIEVDGGEGTAAGTAPTETARDAVMASVRQLVFDKFFEPTFVDVAATYRRRAAVQIEELRSVDLDWRVPRAVERTIHPRADMHDLLTRAGLTRERLVAGVDAAGAPPSRQPLVVMAAAAWVLDGIACISVDIEPQDADAEQAPHAISVLLDPAHGLVQRGDWVDQIDISARPRLRYKYQVTFTDGSVPGPRQSVDSGDWRLHEGNALTLTPRDLYHVMALEVCALPDFPFERWPKVRAAVRYRADDGSFEHSADGVLTAAYKRFNTTFRTDRGVAARRELQLTHFGADGAQLVTPWLPMTHEQWTLKDPLPDQLTVRGSVAGDRHNVANLLVDLEYQDEAHGIAEAGTMDFAGDTIHQPQSWTVALADRTRRRYRYRMTLITKAGEFLQTGWIGTDAVSPPVGEVYVRRLSVDVVTGDLDPRVDAVEVMLGYHDLPNDVHSTRTFRLAAHSRAEWQVPLKDTLRRTYEISVRWICSDGTYPRVGPSTSSETFVVLPGAPPR